MQTILIVRKRKRAERECDGPPATWLGELIVCQCGHGIGRHVDRGCGGSISRRCECDYSPAEILERAIRNAREEHDLEAVSCFRTTGESERGEVGEHAQFDALQL